MFRTSDLTSWTCSSRPFICARALSSAGLVRTQRHSRALIKTKKCLRICSYPVVAELVKLRWRGLEGGLARSPGAPGARLSRVADAGASADVRTYRVRMVRKHD